MPVVLISFLYLNRLSLLPLPSHNSFPSVGEYSYDHWTALSAKKKRDEADAAKAKDPSAGIMDMMKNMYDEGDENMKRIIGEAMLKSQRGEKPDTSMPSMGDMGGL